MDKAVYGLVGVALGFVLTIVKDWCLYNLKRKKRLDISVSMFLVRLIGL